MNKKNIDEILDSVERAQECIMSLRKTNYQFFLKEKNIDYGVNIDTDYARSYLLLAVENLLIDRKANQNAALNCIINAMVHIKAILNRPDLEFEFAWDADEAIDFLSCAKRVLLKILKPSKTRRKIYDHIQRGAHS